MRGLVSAVMAVALAATVGGPLFAGGVAEQIHKGVQAYQRQDYGAAVNAFSSALKREPTSPEAAFDLGTAEYREGKYSQALKAFQKAEAADTASQELQSRASYDQGKSLAKLGDALAAKNPRGALSDYKKGIEAFTRTLQVEPSMKRAGYNIEVLRRRIEKLEQELKKQAQSKNDQKQHQNPVKKNPGRKNASSSPQQNGGQKEPRTGKSANEAGTRSGNQQQQPSSGGKAQSTKAQTTAQQILNAEKDHRRIITLQSQQVSPHVARNW